jgi:hypothetical protein
MLQSSTPRKEKGNEKTVRWKKVRVSDSELGTKRSGGCTSSNSNSNQQKRKGKKEPRTKK